MAARGARQPAGTPHHRSRDRHGRGMRFPLFPPQLPAAQTRSERFDAAVLEAVAGLEPRWPGRFASIEFAVDEVPTVDDAGELPSPNVVLDVGVPLSRFIPPGVDSRGRQTKGRVVVYRRPLEARSADPADLQDLVAEVLEEQISAVLGDGEGG